MDNYFDEMDRALAANSQKLAEISQTLVKVGSVITKDAKQSGEIAERLNNLVVVIDKTGKRLEQAAQELNKARAEDERRWKQVEKKIDKIKENTDWAIFTLGGLTGIKIYEIISEISNRLAN